MAAASHMYAEFDAREYTPEAGQFIVLEYAGGASLRELHQCHPEMVPPPLFVNRWRKNLPQFDLLMREAEEARADLHMESTLLVADDLQLSAARQRNKLAALWKMAAAMDRERYGKGAPPTGNTPDGQQVQHGDTYILSDAQLIVIAMQGLSEREVKDMEARADGRVIDGVLESVEPEGAPPQIHQGGAVSQNEGDTLTVPPIIEKILQKGSSNDGE